MLELSRILKRHPMARTLRFVAFTNEEMPFSRGIDMGSLVYAHRSRSRQEKIVGMWSLETIANFTDEPNTQTYPAHPLSLFYPTTGNFVAFLGDMGSRKDVRLPVKTFRKLVEFPSEGLLAPPWLAGTHRSDHWSFWMMDYPGVMVTDTAPFRYEDYHKPSDTAEKLEYEHMGRVTVGLARVVDVLVNGENALGL
jgi:Zn-dependent M28 family amino/carboxypeptidase